MYTIGLTGGICTGKTFVLNIFKELGCITLRADDIAKDIIFSSNSEILKKIRQVFGEEIYDNENGLDKDKFAKILFTDHEKRNFINNIIHPLVAIERNKIIKDLKKKNSSDFIIYESALLVESATYKEFNKIIVVYNTQEQQIKNLMERDLISLEDAEKRIKSQFPLNEKLKVANYTIDTSGGFENSEKQTLETFHLMKKDFNIA